MLGSEALMDRKHGFGRGPIAALMVAGIVLAATACPAWAGVVARVGVLGDSLSDEYRFADDPPDRAAARNYVEILGAADRLDFGAFATASRGEPRRQGYEFNWARSGARTGGLPEQTAGLAQQAAAGQVDYGFILIGGNDFQDVAAGAADPATAIPLAVTNTVTAARTLLGATAATNPDFRLVVGNVPDVTRTPAARFALAQNPGLAPQFAQLRAGIDQYNAALAGQFASDDRVAVLDTNALFDEILDNPGSQVPGVVLDPATPGPGPRNVFVDPVHAGTVAHARLGNALIDVLNTEFGSGVEPLSGSEILAAAGIDGQPSPGGPNPVPLPPAAWAGLVGLPLAFAATRVVARNARRQAA